VSPDPAELLRVLSPAVRQAAAIARALEGRVKNRPKPGETSDVKQALTIADTAAQEALLVPLLEHFPELRLEAEEDTPSVARFSGAADALVVIDPIDGTLHYYLGAAGPYAVMVGLALAGRFEAALVALPREGLFFEAVRGCGARASRAGGRPRRARLHPQGRQMLLSNTVPEAAVEHLRAHGVEPRSGCGGAVAVAPLVPGVRAGLRVAPGAPGVSIRGRIGALIAREAGARVCTAGGEPFPEQLDAPASALVVAASDGDVRLIGVALRAAGIG
jgi:fructose-1,6-bisphosphatase/inositol monophosphatase family enzyme